MKRLILLAFLFIGLASQAQISTLVGVISKKVTVSSGRTFNISMNNLSTQKSAETGWNQWGNDVENNTLLTDAGSSSTVKLRRSSDPAFQFNETDPPYSWNSGTSITNLLPFTQTSIKVLCYKGSSGPVRFYLEGLDNSKTYNITVVNATDYDDSSSRTDVSFNSGSTYTSLASPLTRVANQYTATGLTPSSGIINIWFIATDRGGGGYTSFNAIKVIEN